MPTPPGRGQPRWNNAGNPLYSEPSLEHPAWNPRGTEPADPQIPMGVLAWTDFQGQAFKSDGTNQVWRYETPVFDLRPGMSRGYGYMPAAIAINHEGALGQGVYLILEVGDTSGVTPPSTRTAMTAAYWEDGNTVNMNQNNSLLSRYTKIINVSDQLYAGGDISTTSTPFVGPPFGASIFQFPPCVSSLRFWKLTFQLTIEGTTAVTNPFFIRACLH